MKRVEAIIRPEKLPEVKAALLELGHAGITVNEVRGHGIERGVSQQWRGETYSVDLIPKVSVMAVVHDHEVNDVVDLIVRASRTDHIGDGKIFVTPVDEVVRIRTGETGVEAI